MSALTEQVAREHQSYSGIGCACGHYPDHDEPLQAARTRHLIAVTEAATRAAVAAEIGSLGHTHEQVQAGVRAGHPVAYYTGHAAAVGRAVQVAKGGGV